LRAEFGKKKSIAKELRVKKTRALRRALTVEEATKKTLRQTKKDNYFPLRKYAVKA
jgi:large subunit ribosomal protein L35e